MANIGFKFTRRNQNVLTTNAQKIAFSSAYPLDKIALIFEGAANATHVHGLAYKPTVLGWFISGSPGLKSIVYVDNYQITNPATPTKSITLFQQGT